MNCGHCKDCRHWEWWQYGAWWGESERAPDGKAWGSCQLAVCDDGRLVADTLAVAQADYAAMLYTYEAFGCVQFEAKQ